MDHSANEILKTIDSLPESEQHTLTVELLRRVLGNAPPNLTDDNLLLIAEELFQRLDAEEASHG